MRILFCNIANMKYYAGAPDDVPRFGGSWEGKAEAYNFYPVRYTIGNQTQEKVLGFFETGHKNSRQTHNQAHIEKIDSLYRGHNEIPNVLVVWCAKQDHKTYRVVGWYKNATVFRYYQRIQEGVLPEERALWEIYNVLAESECVTLLPIEERNLTRWEAPRARQSGYGFGQSQVWYANEPMARVFIEQLVEQIEAYR